MKGTPSTEAVVGGSPTLTWPDSRACCAARTASSACRSVSWAWLQEGQPGIGRRHAGRGALQQPGDEFALEAADLLAQRRGHELEFERGAAHAAQLADLHEVAQLPQFHERFTLTA